MCVFLWPRSLLILVQEFIEFYIGNMEEISGWGKKKFLLQHHQG